MLNKIISFIVNPLSFTIRCIGSESSCLSGELFTADEVGTVAVQTVMIIFMLPKVLLLILGSEHTVY